MKLFLKLEEKPDLVLLRIPKKESEGLISLKLVEGYYKSPEDFLRAFIVEKENHLLCGWSLKSRKAMHMI